jgi:hypothetical protein
MKRKPKPKRCSICGGIRRPDDDYTPEERADPRCWICRQKASTVNGKAPSQVTQSER